MFVAACGMAASCSDDDKYPGKVEFDSGDFVVSKTAMALAGTQEQTLTIKSPVKPTVTSDAEWLHVGQVERASSSIYTIAVWCDANAAYDVRTATITVTAGSNTKTVTVSQYGSETVQIVSATPGAELDPNGGTLTVTYAATGDVIVTKPSWLDIASSRSLEENTYTFTYSANYGDEARGGDIVISLVSDESISAVIPVTQAVAEKSDNMKSSATELASKIFAGVNIGNTMEPPSGEGTWGAAKVTLDYIKGLKALGFNAVRIPCAWDSHISDASTNTIDPAWLDRVNEVVGFAVSQDMYAIVNIHWDGGWLEESCIKGYDEAVDKKQHDYWTQIANKLNHFDEHLLFAGMNEPGQQNQGAVNNASLDAIMAYQQTFVDAVRATGGNNASRVLIHQTPYTNIDKGVEGYYHLPKDVVENRAMAEVHFYDPYQFVMMEKDESWGKTWWYWGAQNHVAGSDRNASSNSEESMVAAQFAKIKNYYASKGIPTVLGEYAVTYNRGGVDGIDVAAWKASRNYWTEVVTREAKNNGLIPFFWETSGDINRNNGSAKNADVIEAIMKGAAEGKYPF